MSSNYIIYIILKYFQAVFIIYASIFVTLQSHCVEVFNPILMNENLKVLLVDDDADDRMFFAEAIKEMASSIRLIYAVDGEDCLNLLAKENPLPDYIFMDLNMPKVNGKDCLKSIKQRGYCNHIPIVIW